VTWVVGMAGGFGYGMGISDIRVTLHDGTEMDCLQKIYQVSNFIAVGFAGSVSIGFAMIDKLKELLFIPDGTLAWDPTAIAAWWPADAREVFEKFSDEERNLQSHLILVGVHPTEHRGNPGWPTAYVYRFRSPMFEAELADFRQVVAIGSGTDFEPCRKILESISTDREAMISVLQGEQGTPGGMLSRLGFQLTLLLKENRPQGISAHLHYCWVYRGRVVIAPNDHERIGRWQAFSTGVDAAEKELQNRNNSATSVVSPGRESFRMPPIAASMEELQSILSRAGLSPVKAVA
jgi:hypothetical protein